ncbi:MAG: ISKra4 family transposase [Hormoscilla sp. GUM202]|nr:ISKra4 family transposase [Hormoscilla sp. GUM202]
MCAKSSYQQAEEDLKTLMGINVGHSTLHRLVQRVELPPAQATNKTATVSVEGGKICLRSEETGPGEWRDYKLVNLHDEVCEAFFQDPDALEQWSEKQPLDWILTCLGDGHPGIWNVFESLVRKRPILKREVLDWFHLMENLYKVGGSGQRLARVENFLWHGWVDRAIAEFDALKNKRARNFQNYLSLHRHRIPCYHQYRQLGIPIGSGSVESKIKQVAARVKLSGARWKRDNVQKILRLRCAYLNNYSILNIYA